MRYQRILRYVDEVARAGTIRKAAEKLNVTASALNRRIMDLEDEVGAKLFERKPQGVRLTSAGELFVQHAREELAEVVRLRSSIEDLRGLRRGTVRIACSQALAFDFIPKAMARFRKRYPLVTFAVTVLDHDRAMAALSDYEVDLVLVYRPTFLANFQPVMKLQQRLVAMMAPDHPLATKSPLRLRDCARHPAALADRSIAGRTLLDEFSARTGQQFSIAIESNSFELLRSCVLHAGMISFQIEIGAGAEGETDGIVSRRIDTRDIAEADLVLGQLQGRSLPVASAVFVETLARDLEAMRDRRAGAAVR
jgi:DNA-binding transcriptional LysR family regulator